MLSSSDFTKTLASQFEKLIFAKLNKSEIKILFEKTKFKLKTEDSAVDIVLNQMEFSVKAAQYKKA